MVLKAGTKPQEPAIPSPRIDRTCHSPLEYLLYKIIYLIIAGKTLLKLNHSSRCSGKFQSFTANRLARFPLAGSYNVVAKFYFIATLRLPQSAPPQRTTGTQLGTSFCSRRFNPRSAWGDRGGGRTARRRQSFNPRPRVGGDLLGRTPLTAFSQVSIRAPAWGATREEMRQKEQNGCFNPRPRVGGDTVWKPNDSPPHGVSIRAPAWGATMRAWPAMSFWMGFNPRPRVGGDSHPLAAKNL